MTNESIKGLPVNELRLVAVCVVLGFNPDAGENGSVEAEMDVIDEPLWQTFKAQNQPNRCGCCGHTLKYACAIVHAPTGTGYWVGRDCAAKVENLRRFDRMIAQHTVALAERLACNKREADFLTAHPEAMSIIGWCRLARAPKIAKDMLEKMRRFGELSEKQITTLESIREKDEARRASATGKALSGRHTVKGTVLSTKTIPGFDPRKMVTKLTIDFGNGVRAFGNAPEYNAAGQVMFPRKGDEVEFTATFEPSKNDELFGFWKRPAKFTITKHNPEDVARWEAIFAANPGLRERRDISAEDQRSSALWKAATAAGLSVDDTERFVYENFNPPA